MSLVTISTTKLTLCCSPYKSGPSFNSPQVKQIIKLHPTSRPSSRPTSHPTKAPVKAASSVNGGAIAGLVIGVLAAVGIAVGAYMHFKNKSRAANSLLKNQSDHGFEDDNI